MNQANSFRNFKYKGHPSNCACDNCSRMRRKESADAMSAWMRFEEKRREDRARRRETRFKRKTERHGRNSWDD
ncbi:MAG: hypothetical protein WC562_02520 [Dehalococcoidia bacterium]